MAQMLYLLLYMSFKADDVIYLLAALKLTFPVEAYLIIIITRVYPENEQ